MCQTYDLKFISGLFEACWFINVFVSHQRLRGKRGHSTLPPTLSPAQKHARAGVLKVMCVSVDFSRHGDQRLGRGTAVWLLTVVTETNYSGDARPNREKGIGTCACAVLYSSQISCSPHLRLPQASTLRLVWLKWEKLEEGVTNRITCCLHLVVIIRALMTGEELIEMKNKLRWEWDGCSER